MRPRSPGYARVITIVAYLLLYVPLLVMVGQSFLSPEKHWTLNWYRQAFSNEMVLNALGISLVVSISSTMISTVLGTSAALAIERSRFPGRKMLNAVSHLPLVMPEIVLGLSLLIWFVALRLTLGVTSIILAHVTFSVSYVMVTVRARLRGFDESIEEAARDLGADRWMTFWKVTLPMIRPGILSGALMAFTLSFDDFLVTFFTAGVGSDTLPLKVYSMIKFGVSPEINALSSALLGVTLVLVFLFSSRLMRNHP